MDPNNIKQLLKQLYSPPREHWLARASCYILLGLDRLVHDDWACSLVGAKSRMISRKARPCGSSNANLLDTVVSLCPEEQRVFLNVDKVLGSLWSGEESQYNPFVSPKGRLTYHG